MGEVRRALAAVSLLVLAVSLASPLSIPETRARFSRLGRALTGDPSYRSDATSFWFDPEYAAFLDDVRRRTPETATVAVLVPASPDLYFDQAVYRLAPRRVVGRDRQDEARFVAEYRAPAGLDADGAAIAHGRLRQR